MSSSERIFSPLQLGSIKTKINRIALAPLTRLRAQEGTQVPGKWAAEYYTQRSSPGAMLVTEATFIAKEAGGYPRAPGIWSPEQIAGWKAVTEGVHSKGGVIFLQQWALGRGNNGPPGHDYDPSIKTVSSSPIPVKGYEHIEVHELSTDDIKRYVGHYAQSAKNAIEAGMDGVEVHGANGYLIDQFTQSNANKRTDAYGGSIEARCKFALEVLEAVTAAVGQGKVGIRLSPWGTFQDMQMSNPYPTFTYLLEQIKARFPNLAYIHLVEPIAWFGSMSYHADNLEEGVVPSNDPFRAIIRGVDSKSETFPDPDEKNPTLILAAAGFTAENAAAHVERTGDVVAFGRWFISNPDLSYKLKHKIPFTPYDRSTFYTHDEQGYITYPASEGVKL